MLGLKYGFISADDHVLEHRDVWRSRMSQAKWGDRIPRMERQADGKYGWIVAGKCFPLPRVCSAENSENPGPPLPQWDNAAAALYGAAEYLKIMDANRIDCSVLYPTAGGLAAENFGKIDDLDLQLACAEAYNDWLIEEWAAVSSRFVPQCIVPIWPMERTVAEIKRAVAKGHRAVIYPAAPMELLDVPHINDPAYDPLWAACQDIGVPLCFHSGASARIQLQPSKNSSPTVAAAFQDIVRSMSSIAVLANFLISGVLSRFPKLKVVFAECSVGWGAYEMEYGDYQSDADGLQHQGYPLNPSKLFRRQCYFTCWYDQRSLRVRRYLGASSILWSAHFPLAASTWPETGRHIETSFGDIPEDERTQILWRNAAELYAL